MKKKTPITTTKEDLLGELKKNSIAHAILYGILVGIVASMLVFCYFSVFSSNFYLRNSKGEYLVGTPSSQHFEKTQSGDLLFVAAYSDFYDAEIDDEVYFVGNSGKGSGIIVSKHISDGYLTIKTGDAVYNVSLSTILGKVTGKAAFWGFVVYFFQSVSGLVVLNILLVLIVAARMILISTTETSAKGRELKAKLAKQKQDYKKRKKMIKRYSKTALDSDCLEILSGSHEQNKQKLFEIAKRKDQSNAYKFLLEKIYQNYLTKPKLSKEEQIAISNCIELMAVAYGFDVDVEYMITDLIIKCPVVDFDMQSFKKTCIEEIEKTGSIENLGRFCSVIYVLTKLNPSLKTKEMVEICDAVLAKINNKKFVNGDVETKQDLQNLTEFIKKMIEK